MDAILLKIKADLLSRPLISGLILVTIVTSSTLLTLALATLTNISGPYDQSFDELNAAHLWLFFDRSLVNKRDIARVEKLSGVAATTGLRYNAVAQARLGPERVWVTLRQVPTGDSAVHRLLLQQGRGLSQQPGELVASTHFRDTGQIAVGDVVEVTAADGREVPLTVAGLVYDPMWDVYDNAKPPYLYLGERTLRALFPDESTWGWDLGLRLRDAQAVDETLRQVETALHGDVLEGHSDWRVVRESALFEVRMNLIFLGAFGLFAVLATVLVVASSIGSIVLSQFRQIGILKAIGFAQDQVMWLYLGQHLVLCLVGGCLGFALGLVLAPLPLRSVATLLNFSYRPPVDFGLMLAVLAIVMGSVLLATWGTARRGARANIVRSIAVGAEAPQRRPPWPVRAAMRLGLPVVILLGLNDLFARPGRSLMTAVNLALGVIGIVFGLTINETVDAYSRDPSLLGLAHDAIVTRETFGDGKTRHILRGAPGIEAFYGERRVEVETEAGQAFEVRAVDGDLGAFPFQVEQGRFLQPDTLEAMAGRGLLDWLGAEVGDSVTVYLEEREGRPITWQIVGQYAEPANVGRMLMVNLGPLERLLPNPEPTVYMLKLAPGADVDRLKQTVEPRPDSDLALTLVEEVMPEDVVYLQYALYALSAILIGMALINVFNSTLLAVKEKMRAIGILKTVGMTPAQVVVMVNTSAGLLGLAATLFGIPLGLLLTKSLLEIISASYGFGNMSVSPNLLYLACLVPLVVIVSVFGSLLPGRWAARLSIVRVLSSE